MQEADFIDGGGHPRHAGACSTTWASKSRWSAVTEHDLKERGEHILDRIAAGETCALCTDAGMPAVSDPPGEVIVRDAHARGIPVVPVPAASAAVTALCVSGQPTGRFVFEGFLPTNRRQKKERLAALQNEERTVIFYEAPHKLPTTLQDLEQALAGAGA